MDNRAIPVLAIDFGTSNTYITKCPGDQSTPIGVDFGEGRDGVATAILYRQGKESIIGDKALEEFGDANEAERRAYTIRTQFKPDIAHSAEARKYSCDFLAGMLREAAQRHIEINPAERQVIFGVPSEADAAYHNALIAVALQAGFGAIKLVDEPKGAIYFHLQRKDISPKEALQGALVVDFGGGTNDFAVVVKGEIQHSWGDMHFGGRLFDDVFYQWFIEQNPRALDAMQAEHAEFFVLWYECRKVKEKFSQTMASDRSTVFRKTVGEFGRLTDATWEKFLQRIQAYKPSATFTRYMREVNPSAINRFAAGAPVDLLAWFRQSLLVGLQHENVRAQKIDCVVLTGGSSSWPFVPEIVMAEMAALGYHPRLIRSDRPYATISEGLAIIPSLQRRFVAVQDALHREAPTFIQEKLYPLVERRMEEAAGRIANAVTESLFDERIQPILHEFRQSGGSVASLKAQIAQQATAFEPQIETIVDREMTHVFAGLPLHISELMTEWFKTHDLLIDDQLKSDKLGEKVDSQVSVKDIDLYGDIEAVIGMISVSVIAVVVSSISGGAGTALIAVGPLGIVLGAIIGVIAGSLVVTFGLEEARRRAEQWEGAPVWLISRTLTDQKIAGIRKDINDQIRENTLKQTHEAQLKLEQEIYKRVEEEIENLSAIQQV